MGGHEEPPAQPRAVIRRRGGERVGLDRPLAASSATTSTRASRSNPKRASPRRASVGAELAAGDPLEEVALEPALLLGHRPGLRELDREQRQRVAGHDAVELARRIGLAHGQERLDATLRADRLHPDVMAAIHERQREARAVGPRRRAPRPTRASRRRLAARDVDASARPCRSSNRAHPRVTVRERRGDARRSRRPSSAGAREHVLGVDGALQRVELLREQLGWRPPR